MDDKELAESLREDYTTLPVVIHLREIAEGIARLLERQIVPIQTPAAADCAVDQNEVVCAHPGCTGPYNCKERGLQE